jgi:hypothetical protein
MKHCPRVADLERWAKKIHHMKVISQRDKMRELYHRFHGKKEAVVDAYAAAEKAHEVERKKNISGISGQVYAERLFADGVRKQWVLAS